MTTSRRPGRAPVREARRPLDLRRWVLACVVAETIGMTAASAAAWTSRDLDSTLLIWVVVVSGGLVEGAALGALQAAALRPWLGAAGRRGWVVVTLLVAGVGWGAASAPSVAAGEPSSTATGAEPPLALVLLAAAGLGLVMGLLLGAAQTRVLRHALPMARRWTWVSALAWTLTMPVIFLGASRPEATWSLPALLLTGALTGALAGATYGVTTALLLPGLEGRPPPDRVALAGPTRRV